MCHVPDASTTFAAYAISRFRKKGRALAKSASTTVGVLGEDPLTSRVLGLVLSGAGYEARALDAGAVLDAPGEALACVDVVLLVPWFGDEAAGELVGAIRGDPATAAVPVLGLSAVLREGGPEERAGSVPWPWSVENLGRAIEGALGRAVLAPEPGGEAP
jgi:hypothetical protein